MVVGLRHGLSPSAIRETPVQYLELLAIDDEHRRH
jgi:hypothetical protein